ncbi:BTB/POZ domain-containing protein [Dorcoceras hygrometricum]|uniref:BTB/POZ domain-containing protein n=1 Tax=Dorcoceras hygrometricum TaxID=472368 RepID=A0A2Z7AXJ1_9LAMI|nr:BTB/POZ domain-containing protein [Dorcoceras hygrometricum]
MKFMKLGSRPDTFYAKESVRSVSSEVSSDLIIQVKGSRYLLHKFPLLSKSLRLQRLCLESPEASQIQIVPIPDFPAGLEAFEVCAKFCYGITITLSAYNLVSVRCAAEYLQMTEDVEKGNLIYKIEVFFNSCILHGWRDSIVTLQTTKAFPLLSEDLGITSRCIESIASKVLTNPTKANLSHSYSRKERDNVSCNGSECRINKAKGSTKGWWGEDTAELGIDLYWRTMIAIKAGGKVPSNLIGDALRIYASRWLPNVPKISMDAEKDGESDRGSDSNGDKTSKARLLLESIVSLLPAERGAASCSFLLKLLKAANMLKASSSTKMELVKRVGIQLDEATVGDFLIPSLSTQNGLVYDVDIVLNILEHFTLQGQSPPVSPRRNKRDFERRRSRSAENLAVEFQENRRSSSASHSSKLKVGKLVDKYLQEIARDKNLPLSKFIAVAEAIPDFSRLVHDDLYKAIDVYLKVHPELDKSERKSLCRILDCKKLSVEACMHAAQNEMLPLRVVVQVLFFEQARTAQNGGQMAELPSEIKALLAAHKNPLKQFSTNMPAEDQLSVPGQKSPPPNAYSSQKVKPVEENNSDAIFPDGVEKSWKLNSLTMVPHKPKRMFSKLWPINRSASEKN